MAKAKAAKSEKPAGPPKIRVGWFSFSCCEDSTIMFTEIMNDHWQEWKHLFDFRHARVLQSKNTLDEMDIAFVEGAIASDKHAKELEEIRSLSKVLVAIGSCACTGMPSAQRNTFDEKKKQEIEFLLARFGAAKNVRKLADVVKVDAQVPGCPMDTKQFLAAVEKLVAQFRGPKSPSQ